MNGRKRLQFSVGNLMLMMVPLAVVFGLVSQVPEKNWVIWTVALVIVVGPAIGALVGGSRGMWRGVGWLVIVALHVYAVAVVAAFLSVLLDAIIGQPQVWTVCVAVSLTAIGPAIGAWKGGLKGAVTGFDVGLAVLIVSVFAIFVAIIVAMLAGARFVR